MINRRRLYLALTVLATVTCSRDTTGPGSGPARIAITGHNVVYLGSLPLYQAVGITSKGDTIRSAVTWRSSDPTVATIDQNGVLSPIQLGHVVLTAALGKVSDTIGVAIQLVPVVKIRVTPAEDSIYVGDSVRLIATFFDSVGDLLTGRAFQWKSSDTTHFSIDTTGLAVARHAGSAAVTITVDSAVGGAFLESQLRVTTLVMPDSISLQLHHPVLFVPGLFAATGTRLSDRGVAWSASDTTAFQVSSSGQITPVRPGSAWVFASLAALRESTLVRIVPEALKSIGVNCGGCYSSVTHDSTVHISVVMLDSSGTEVDDNPVTWASSDSTILTVAGDTLPDAGAAIRGGKYGSAVITASSGGLKTSIPLQTVLLSTHLVVHPDSVEVAPGGYVFFYGYLEDSLGNTVARKAAGDFLTHTVDSTIARGSDNGLIGVRKGRTGAVIQVSGYTDTVPVIVRDSGTNAIHWTNDNDQVEIAELTSFQNALQITDSAGAPVTKSKTIRVWSSDTTVVTVPTPNFVDSAGLLLVPLIARHYGHANVYAQTDSIYASFPLVVDSVYLPPLTLTPHALNLRQGDTVRLAPNLSSHLYSVAWTSSDPSRATVDTGGLVTAVAGGTTRVTASARGAHDTASITVISSGAPVISAAAPDTLKPGASITLSGTGFDPTPASNTVSVDGVAAAVTGATATSLTFTVATQSQYQCAAGHFGQVVVNSAGRVATANVPFLTAPRWTASTGSTQVLTGTGTTCVEIEPTGGAYLITLSNTSPDPALGASFQVLGDYAFQVDSALTMSAPQSARSITTSRFVDSLRTAQALRRGLLEQARNLWQRFGNPVPGLLATRQTRAGLALSPGAAIDGIVHVRVPRADRPDYCSSYVNVDARIVWTGAHTVVLEDTLAPLAGLIDQHLRPIGQEFDTAMYPILTKYFGDPFAMDSALGGTRHVTILLSPAVNAMGPLAFVSPCDFFPEDEAPASNTAEIIYAQVPTVWAGGFASYTPDAWRRVLRSSLMHEAKHLTAFAVRLSRGIQPETPWLEEASAVVAEELWTRNIYHSTWRGGTVYSKSLYCDVRPTFPECADAPFAMFNPFAFLWEYANQIDRRSPFGPTDDQDGSPEGSAWALLRWSIDQYASTEDGFLRALVQEPAATGIDNLAARTGQPFDQLYSDWAVTMQLRDGGMPLPVGTVPARFSFPSWNLADITDGMANDFPGDFPDPFPFRTPGGGRPFGVILSDSLSGPGGSVISYFIDGPQSGRQFLRLAGPGGGAPPANSRVEIIRTQ